MKIKIKIPKQRNYLVIVCRNRKAGKHKLSERKLTRNINKHELP